MNGFNNQMTPQRNQFSSYFNPAPGATTPTNNIIWVQGIEGAKAWQLNPSSMAILLDSEVEGKMYIKVSDNIGMSSLRSFSYIEDVAPPASAKNEMDLSDYVRKDELSSLIKEIVGNEQSISTASDATPTTVASKAKSITVLNK